MGGVVRPQVPRIAQAGIDTISFYLCLEGSASVRKVGKASGRPAAYGGTMLGDYASWGEWAHSFGYPAIWRPERSRLYLHPKLALPNELCPIDELDVRSTREIERLAAVGVVAHHPPYVTRVDVAADGLFQYQKTAKNLLNAIYSSRPPGGGKTGAMGDPLATVYVYSRSGKDKLARAYDKGREMRESKRRGDGTATLEPYSLIRLESIHRFKPETLRLSELGGGARGLWQQGFMALGGDRGLASVIPFDQLRARIVQSVRTGELRPAQGERMRLFLELEGTGEAEGYYGPKQFSDRRREARTLGLRVEDAGRQAQDFELEAILRAYDESPLWGEVGHEIAATPGSGSTVAA
jgi:hypothetical protein